MKNNDRLQDWLYMVPVTGGRREFYTTYSFETNLTFILADFFQEGNKSSLPDSTTVFSFFYGIPEEERVMESIAQGEQHTIFYK